MAAPVFIEAEYADPPCTGLETREADGTWLGCTAYTHAASGSVVLWYGGETYEGLGGGGYRWGAGARGAGTGGSGAPPGGEAPELLDGDGDVVPTRWAAAEGRGRGAQAPAGMAAVAATAAAKHPRFLPFEEALVVARSLNLTSSTEWRVWSKEGLRPANVPSAPDAVYKDRGWQGWGHWLGTGNTRNATVFLPFKEALAVARSLGLPGRMEWRVWSKEGLRPANVPSMPNRVYKDHGWQGWGHWLGHGNQQTKLFLPFEEALVMAQSLGLASKIEWKVWSKEGLRPANVPADPPRVYEDHGWQGWGHWLGTGNTRNATVFLPFGEALAVARSLGLPGMMEWQVWSKEGLRPPNMPSNPNVVYKDHGWQRWGHWLGTGNLQTKVFLPFEEALVVARSLGLASSTEWRVWSKEGLRPANVPSAPDVVYKDHGWRGWGHWLGTGNLQNKQFLPFEEALAVARSLNLASSTEWWVWSKEGLRPANVPSMPNRVYKDHGWQGWGHWLGTGNTRNTTKFLPCEEARTVARSLRLASHKEWLAWCRTGARPANVPAAPDKVYVHDGWMGWVHWLYHANLGPPTTPAVAPSTRKRSALGRTSIGESSRKRRWR